jgi:hypothetical protein
MIHLLLPYLSCIQLYSTCCTDVYDAPLSPTDIQQLRLPWAAVVLAKQTVPTYSQNHPSHPTPKTSYSIPPTTRSIAWPISGFDAFCSAYANSSKIADITPLDVLGPPQASPQTSPHATASRHPGVSHRVSASEIHASDTVKELAWRAGRVSSNSPARGPSSCLRHVSQSERLWTRSALKIVTEL